MTPLRSAVEEEELVISSTNQSKKISSFAAVLQDMLVS